MPVKAHIDKIETLDMQEKYGSIVSVTRVATVTGITGTDWSVMYDVLDAAGIPAKNSYLDTNRASHLVLQDRNVKMIDKDKAEVTLNYGVFSDKGQNLFYSGVVTARPVSGKMTTSVAQKQTNLFREGGTGPESLIVVSHTYPPEDADYGGQTLSQTGMIDVSIPQRTFTLEGIKNVRAPWEIVENLTGAVNDRVWMGQPMYTWMCTEVTWEYREYLNYFMTFTFQHNPDTWNPTAVFNDPRTGVPPENLVPDTGYKYIRYHRAVNFLRELGFYIIGPAQ